MGHTTVPSTGKHSSVQVWSFPIQGPPHFSIHGCRPAPSTSCISQGCCKQHSSLAFWSLLTQGASHTIVYVCRSAASTSCTLSTWAASRCTAWGPASAQFHALPASASLCRGIASSGAHGSLIFFAPCGIWMRIRPGQPEPVRCFLPCQQAPDRPAHIIPRGVFKHFLQTCVLP